MNDMTYEQAMDWFKQELNKYEEHVPFQKAVEALKRCIDEDATKKEA